MLGAHGREEIDKEGKDPESKDESDDPFENGARVRPFVEGADSEGDGENDCETG